MDNTYDWKISQLKQMLNYETIPEQTHYGANLKHPDSGAKPIQIDAGGIKALIEYYSTHTPEEN